MPTASTTAAPTDRQLAFFNNLLRERGAAPIEAFAPGTTRREASEAIDGLLATPRPATATATPSGDHETLVTPSPEGRAGRMLLAGGIEATVTFPDGRHCTVEVRTRGRRGNGFANMAPGEEGARTNIKILGYKVGWINVVDGEWRLTLRTRRDEYRQAVHAVFEYAGTGDCAGGERVQEASRCGRCFRQLTDPVSIDRGIGPECFGRDTGSQHIAADRDRNGTAVAAREATATRREELRPTYRADTGCGGCDNGEHCGACACCHEQSLAVLADALSIPAPRRPTAPAPTPAPAPRAVSEAEIRRARHIIEEALDLADIGNEDSVLALRVFDALKR